MDLPEILKDISPESLTEMSGSFGERAAMLAREQDPAAGPWVRLYGYLSVLMDCAAIEQRTGISLD
jgi:hypothetical protein